MTGSEKVRQFAVSHFKCFNETHPRRPSRTIQLAQRYRNDMATSRQCCRISDTCPRFVPKSKLPPHRTSLDQQLRLRPIMEISNPSPGILRQRYWVACHFPSQCTSENWNQSHSNSLTLWFHTDHSLSSIHKFSGKSTGESYHSLIKLNQNLS